MKFGSERFDHQWDKVLKPEQAGMKWVNWGTGPTSGMGPFQERRMRSSPWTERMARMARERKNSKNKKNKMWQGKWRSCRIQPTGLATKFAPRKQGFHRIQEEHGTSRLRAPSPWLEAGVTGKQNTSFWFSVFFVLDLIVS